MQRLANRTRRATAALLLLGLAGAPAWAAEPEDAGGDVSLDRLLTLPSGGADVRVEKRGGSTKAQWEARFESARKDLEAARQALEKTRGKLEDASADSDAWRMSAPGVGSVDAAADSPLDYKLSQELRHQREDVDRLERRLQDLEVEANLAGVPPDWRGSGGGDESAGGDESTGGDAPATAGAGDAGTPRGDRADAERSTPGPAR